MANRSSKKQSRGVVFGVWAALLFSGCAGSGVEVKGCDASLFGTAPVTSEGGGFRFEKATPVGKTDGSGDTSAAVGMSKDAKELAVGETFFLEGLRKIQAPQAAEMTLPVYRLVSSAPEILRVELSKKPLCCAANAKKNGGCFSLLRDSEIASCANGLYNEKFGLNEVGAVFYQYDARLDALRLGEAQVVLLEGEAEAVEKDRFTFHISPHDWLKRSMVGSLGFVRYGLLGETSVEFEGKDGKKSEKMGLLVAGETYTLERKAALLGDADPMGPAVVTFRSERQAVVGVESEKVGLCCPNTAESSTACREVRSQEAMVSCQGDKETTLLVVYRVKLEGRAAGPAWVTYTQQESSDKVVRQALSFEDPKEMSLSVTAAGFWDTGNENAVVVSLDKEGMTLVLATEISAPVVSLVAQVHHVRYGVLNATHSAAWSVTPAESASISVTNVFASRGASLLVKKAELFEVSVEITPQLTRSFSLDARNAKLP